MCVICGFPVKGKDLTCSDRCFTEFKNRREIALARMRAIKALKKERNGGRTLEEITSSIVVAMARVLLERDIPMYASGADLDQEICELDPLLGKMTGCFRKRQITCSVDKVYYRTHAHSGKGKPTFILHGDKEAVRQKLEDLVQSRGC
jgi:predicted nucleic acid-binding Zn ribbon protein